MKVLSCTPDLFLPAGFLALAQRAGFQVVSCPLISDAKLKLSESKAFSICIFELETAAKENFRVLREMKAIQPHLIPILIASKVSLEHSLQAAQGGAFECLTLPFESGKLVSVLEKAHARLLALEQFTHAPKELSQIVLNAPKHLIGSSPSMLEVYQSIARATQADKPVLILGETGTGKELAAKAIHHHSNRKHAPFIAINCGALPEALLESELFGHTKGAFTGATESRKGVFEQAHGGTLFLDEIGDVSPALQVKLLRTLQEQEIKPVGSNQTTHIDVRVISATHQKLESLVKEGRFREDLYYRIKVLSLKIPALRERREDIKELVDYFLIQHQLGSHKEVRYVSSEAMVLLSHYSWPGNVRELEHAIDHALSHTTSPVLFPDDFPHEIVSQVQAHLPTQQLYPTPEMVTLDELECTHILRVLEFTDFNIAHTARILGIDRSTLYRKAQKYQIVLKPAEEDSFERRWEKINC